MKAQDTITASEARNFIGKQVTLCDRVNYGRFIEVQKKMPKILYVGPDYPNHHLTLIFPKEVHRKFSYDPEKKMVNKRFCLTGTISKYKGKPAVFIKSPLQINEED